MLFLFTLAIVGMFFYIVQLLGQWRDVIDITWHFDWIINIAAWDVAMLLIVVVFMWLWLPCDEIKAIMYHQRAPLEWRGPRDNNANNPPPPPPVGADANNNNNVEEQ